MRWQLVEPGKMLEEPARSLPCWPTAGDGGTEVTYQLAVDLKIPMIGMIKRKAEKVIVDTALKELKKRVEGH